MTDIIERLLSAHELATTDVFIVAAAEIERLRAELSECKKDAERYRWLRDEGDGTWAPLRNRCPNLDAVIDAALGVKEE